MREDRQYSWAFPTLISEQIKDFKVGALPISKDRSEDGDKIVIIYDGKLDVSVSPNRINDPYAIIALDGIDNKTRNLVYDSIKYDIDGDGDDEYCSLVRENDTSGQKSGRLLVREEGEIEYKYDFEIEFLHGESLYFGTAWTSNDELIIESYDGGCIMMHLGYFKIEDGELIKYQK